MGGLKFNTTEIPEAAELGGLAFTEKNSKKKIQTMATLRSPARSFKLLVGYMMSGVSCMLHSDMQRRTGVRPAQLFSGLYVKSH